MELTNFTRIAGAVDVELLKNTHIIGIGAGGAFGLYEGLTRSGVGKLTVLDFDHVEDTNIVRQGYGTDQIGKAKVNALGDHLEKVNAGTDYKGITKDFLGMDEGELDAIFKPADLFLFVTDSFKAQAFGNKLALKYNKPAIWAGFYEKSQCAEIVFTIPGVTPACFRCGVSPRYEVYSKGEDGTVVSSSCNTIFHSQLLDSYVGMLAFAILHNKTVGYEFSNWFGEYWDRNLLQLKVHPSYGTEKGSLFDRVFASTGGRCPNFNAIWQKIEQEIAPKYESCPDCLG